MNQELESKIAYLSALSFDGADPLNSRESYHGDLLSDIFIASIIANLDKTTARQIIKDMQRLVDISKNSNGTGLSKHPRYMAHRLDGINFIAETLRTSHEQENQ